MILLLQTHFLDQTEGSQINFILNGRNDTSSLLECEKGTFGGFQNIPEIPFCCIMFDLVFVFPRIYLFEECEALSHL